MSEIIGSGSFSSVRLATHIETSIDRAVKIIAKNVLTDDQTQNLVNEVEALKSFDHPNIVRIIEVVEDNFKLNIITELCKGGELFDRIFKNRPFTENTAARYMFQLFSGLIHIHQKGFIHGDLKPENILLLTEAGDSLLKIIDFGISKQCTGKCKLNRFIGTVIFT
jgi:calcium-dependent protein kinase